MPPSYWRLETHNEKHDEPTLYESRYMRRKIEYLLRTSAVHPDGCCGHQGLRNARVVKVERLENVTLWNRYVEARDARCKKTESAWVQETCRPIRCDLGDNERYFFHGTKADNVESILRDGFDIEYASDRAGRYGDGIYFSDASCKSHQYADCGDVCGGAVYCMLYCRVALGDTMRFNATKQAAARNFLVGMKRPSPGDQVFEQNVTASGGKAKARSEWHSLAVLGGSNTQVHREYVTFDCARIYPEYVVYYRLDSEEEEASARQPRIDAAKARLKRLEDAMQDLLERENERLERENERLERENEVRRRKEEERRRDYDERWRRYKERRKEWRRQHDAFMAEQQRLFEEEMAEIESNPRWAEQKREEVQRILQRVREDIAAIDGSLSAEDRIERVRLLVSEFQEATKSTLSSPALAMTPPAPPRALSPSLQRSPVARGECNFDSSDSSDDLDELLSFYQRRRAEREKYIVSVVMERRRPLFSLALLMCEQEEAEEELQEAERRVVDVTPQILRPDLLR